jgi:hypothetical protein
MFENRVLRRIFGSERDEATGEWRIHKEKLRALYSSRNIIRVMKSRMRWAGRVVRMAERRFACGMLVGKPERKKPLGKHRRR